MKEKCGFYAGQVDALGPTGAYLKSIYCLKDAASCARNMLSNALGGVENVPTDVMPHELHKIKSII